MLKTVSRALLGALVGSATTLAAQAPSQPARATETADAVVLENGLVRLTVNKKSGAISLVEARIDGEMARISDNRRATALYLDFNGMPAVIDPAKQDRAPRAGYGGPGNKLNSVTILQRGPDAAEVALDAGPFEWLPFHVRYHFRVPRGERGWYAWAHYSHGPGMAAGTLGQTRFVFRGRTDDSLFDRHVVDDARRDRFPTGKIIETVQDATERYDDGRVYTKYQNSAFTHEYLAHGIAGDRAGVWLLWPSTEFNNGGPLRQDLTVHTEQVLLVMFQSGHFSAPEIRVEDDEPWSRFCGPVFFYVNEADSFDALHDDAKQRARQEQASWPYRWLKDPNYPLERGSVRGQVKLADGASTAGAWAVLGPVEDADFSLSAKGYQFWTKLDAEGRFSIEKVRPGPYQLTISGADQFDDFRHATVNVSAAEMTDVGTLTWKPVTHGRTLWQVGTADRGTAEFVDGADPRNYEMFLNYFKRFPNDVVFTIGQSKEASDWYYAQWNWFNETPAWTIRFDVPQPLSGQATLTLGLAAHQYSGALEVAVNGQRVGSLSGPRSGAAGYRSASQDSRYTVERINFDAALLKPGTNAITLQHRSSQPIPPTPEEIRAAKRPRGYVMYDAIRLEVDESAR
jgi:rhamnogalacturonan endolyase